MFGATLYFKLEISAIPKCAENLTDIWLEWVNAVIPVNESTNSTPPMEMVYAPIESLFVHNGYHSPSASECLDSQCTEGNAS